MVTMHFPLHIFDSFERLYKAVSSLPPRLEPLLWAGIDELINITPHGQDGSFLSCYIIQVCVSNI